MANDLPRPEAFWIALGIIAGAIAATFAALLGRKARRVFLDFMTAFADQQERLERIVTFGARRNSRSVSEAVAGGVSFVRRLVSELEDGEAS